MTLSLPSSFVVASRGWFATNVIEKASSKESGLFILRGNYPVPCRLKFAQPLYTDKLLSRKNRQTVFAVPDGCDKDERGSTYARNDGQMSSNFQNDESINDLDLELMYPALRSGREISRSIEQHGERTLLEKLKAIHLHVLASEQWNASRLALCHRNYLASATNLIHYLAMKALDVEQLREEAASIGLNLETIYPHVLASLTALIRIFDGVHSESSVAKGNSGIKIWSAEHVEKKGNGNFTIHAMRKKASFEIERLLGPFYDANTTHIMVTVGPETAQSETVIPDLLKRGTTIIRINCAHGDPNVWTEIVRKVKHSSLMLEKPCRVLMDLAGPKLRTDRLKPGPGVMKISPKRNASGNVIIPAQVWLLQKGSNPPVAHVYPDADAVLYIDGQDLLTRLEPGDSLRLLDARGKKRILKINRKLHLFGGTGFIAECARTAYVHTGAEIFLRGKKGKDVVGQIVDVPPSEPFIRLKVGDLLMIYRHSPPLDKSASAKPTHNAHTITCSSSYLFDSVKPGDPIAFDDGKIWGVIQGTSMSEIIVSVTHAAPKGTKLGSDKSINIPRSEIQFKGLTSKDLRDLDFVASQADMVGVSFVRDVQDIIMLKHELDQRKLENLGIVLKIETRRGFENLPMMLLEAMKCPNPLGVMIARGDLAVECGWEKLADLQEEILTICGAAHVPVIWATQVLESLVKSGVPTRAEITDVACGKRASCIMLNKGKNIMEAVSTLNAILRSCSLKMKADLKPFVLTTNTCFSYC